MTDTIIELEIIENGNKISVTGKIIKEYEELKPETLLSSLTLLRLASLLVSFQEEELEDDESYLENFLDAVDEDWREKVINELEEENQEINDPWEILGLENDIMDLEKIQKKYRELMHNTHPDKTVLPGWINQRIREAYEQITNIIKANEQ